MNTLSRVIIAGAKVGRIARSLLLPATIVIAGSGGAARAETLSLLPRAPELDADGSPKAWKPLVFKKINRHTRYEWDPGERAIHAVSSSSVSGLVFRLDRAASRSPIIRWRWKVRRAVERGDESSRSGDDYAARIYVMFRYDPAKADQGTRFKYGLFKKLHGEYPPHSGISYIWANRLPKGRAAPNPHSDRVMMLAVRSGNEDAGKWLSEERDIVEDYRRLFKAEPPPLTGIAIMTDTDDTGSVSEAWYADIELSSPP